MTTLAALCARIGIDEAAARQALGARTGRDDAPWYMQAVLGIGAWITAIAALFFAWAVMDLVFGIDEPNLIVALAGAVTFAASLGLLHHRPDGAFASHAAVAFATAGALLVAAGIGFPSGSLWQAAIVILPFAAAAVWQQRSLLLQFLVVSVALILVMLAAWDHWDRVTADFPAVSIPAGAALLLYPPRRDVRPAAFALLIVPQLVDIVASDFESGWAFWFGWPAKVLMLSVFLLLLLINCRQKADSQGWLVVAGGVAAVAVAILLPTGASAGLVLLALAYTLVSRSLAVVGAVAETYFIWRFYADLQSTLLIKSIILMSVGGVLLIGYGLLMAASRGRRSA